MRIFLLAAITILSISGMAQTSLTPGKNAFEKKWIKNDAYQMTWSVERDTMRSEIGEVWTQVITNTNNVLITTEVKMKNATAPWVDSTIADIATLAPIRHASYNRQRDMVLNFGKRVTGFYLDHQKQKRSEISDTTSQEYFDGNLYPALIAWLPLAEGYKRDIAIYEYNPAGRIGVIKASIKDVASGTYQSTKSGKREVFVVTVSDEIGDENNRMIYYIDKKDRRLWKQEINAAGRKMMMVRKEG